MVAIVSIAMVALIIWLGVRGYRKGNEEAARHLRIVMSKRKCSPEVYEAMRGAGYDV